MNSNYPYLRRIHIGTSALICIISIAHLAVTFWMYPALSPDAVWFFGAGLGIFLTALNLAHIGVEPCRQPTARFVRLANVVYALLGVISLRAVPEPQAFALAALLMAQALISHWTLPGRGSVENVHSEFV